jgi:8-oxo-dGTP pyrophosphatase MutT (NUDIX family)
MTETEHAEPMAHARAAAGVLFFDETGRVLLVRPSYKPGWDIPGGYLHPGETPTEAAAREVSEELGITPPIGRMLVVDWAPHPDEGDKILFVLDGGQLAPEYLDQIKLDPAEITEYAFHDPELIGQLLVPRLARRLSAAIASDPDTHTAYLEHGHRMGSPQSSEHDAQTY